MENLMALNPTAKDGGSVAIGREPMRPTADLPAASPLKKRYPVVERRENLSPINFFSDFVAKHRPVVVPRALKHCRALSWWTDDYLREVAGNRTVILKQGLNEEGIGGLKTITSRLSDYLDRVADFEARLQRNDGSAGERPPYLHDLPLLSVLPEAANDLGGFPSGYFPDWYRADWLKFAQFFLGPSHSLTPLHFDCLLTHNLFFQVRGRKRFILLPHDQLPFCYRYQWRWCEVDAETPDFIRHPLYRNAQIQECIVEPGDMLYMPPGMLHHVRSLDCSMGCSTGNTILSLIKRTTKPLRLVGVDNSVDMLAECESKLTEVPDHHRIELIDRDLASRFVYENGKADVVILNLSLQFIRPLLRPDILQNAYQHIESGGCLILVEKTIQNDQKLNKLFIDYYHNYKKEMGYSDLEISNKREALENKLIPFFLDENIALLKEAGFSHISQFFQWMNFSGILAIKD